jgi:hypothetical protein
MPPPCLQGEQIPSLPHDPLRCLRDEPVSLRTFPCSPSSGPVPAAPTAALASSSPPFPGRPRMPPGTQAPDSPTCAFPRPPFARLQAPRAFPPPPQGSRPSPALRETPGAPSLSASFRRLPAFSRPSRDSRRPEPFRLLPDAPFPLPPFARLQAPRAFPPPSGCSLPSPALRETPGVPRLSAAFVRLPALPAGPGTDSQPAVARILRRKGTSGAAKKIKKFGKFPNLLEFSLNSAKIS